MAAGNGRGTQHRWVEQIAGGVAPDARCWTLQARPYFSGSETMGDLGFGPRPSDEEYKGLVEVPVWVNQGAVLVRQPSQPLTPAGDRYSEAVFNDPDGSMALEEMRESARRLRFNQEGDRQKASPRRRMAVVGAAIVTTAAIVLNLGGARDAASSIIPEEKTVQQYGQCWAGGQNLGPIDPQTGCKDR